MRKNIVKKAIRSCHCCMITNGELLKPYKKFSDKINSAKNFRLFYKDKATNLIWYDGKIIFLPQEYSEMKNLVNIDLNKKVKCSLFASDINLIKELKKQGIPFILEANLEELFSRIGMFDQFLGDNQSIEMIDDNDYTKIDEPIYLGSGLWLNLS